MYTPLSAFRGSKWDAVAALVGAYREAARDVLLSENPALRDAYQAELKAAIKAKVPEGLLQ